MRQLIRVATRDEIPDGTGKVVEAGGRKLAVFHSNGNFYAIDNACRHRGGPLGEGEVYGTTVVCPWHGWEYDFSTGCNVDDPAMRLACLSVRVEGDDIFIEL
ncbi:MAG TPA: Rieske 2Fe-2S domain-containing protein [Candidatus Binataceae bacterium]|nr:Rieske 2Fe-2S domain-containing protein [Candidatus Binataceae bacterium]